MKLSPLSKSVLSALTLAALAFPVKAVTPTLPAPAADVFLVYQGKSTVTGFNPAVSTKGVTTAVSEIYVVTDLAFPYNYSILTIDTDGTYSISTRVLGADGTTETAYDNGVANASADPASNFIAGVDNSTTKPKITDRIQLVICVPSIAATFLEGLGLEDPAAEV